MSMSKNMFLSLDPHILSLLADPITKQPAPPAAFRTINGVLDARVFLKNTHGFTEWAEGQVEYEYWSAADGVSEDAIEAYLAEIAYDRPIYDHFQLDGKILDCGGGVGTVREFLPESVEFVSTDPYINAPFEIQPTKLKSYKCLSRPLNFIGATAEFLPFVSEAFDWVHMRSMLDHVQVPDLALLEARRVLKPTGRVLIGLYVTGGKSGVISMKQKLKKVVKAGLVLVGIDRWKDHHVWHPTYNALIKLITDNGLVVDDVYWQPHWNDTVCYVCARKVGYS